MNFQFERLRRLVFCVLTTLLTLPAFAGDNVWTFDGLAGGWATAVGISPVNDDFRLAASRFHIYRWDVASLAWARVAPGRDVNFAFSTSDSQTAFAANDAIGVLRTTDGGLTLVPVNTGLPSTRALSITIGADGRVYVGLVGEGVWISGDLGASWQAARDGWPLNASGNSYAWADAIAAAPSNANRVYGIPRDEQLHMSDDGGQSWSKPANVGLPDTVSFSSTLFVGPSDADHVYIAGPQSFESLDAGATWTPLALPYLASITAAPSTPDTFFASSIGSDGIYRSEDAGQSWVFEGDLGSNTYAMAVAATGAAMVASHDGLIRRASNASPWLDSNTGFTATTPGPVIQHPTTGRLYAGTNGHGIYSSSDQGASWQLAGGGSSANGGLPLLSSLGLVVSPTNDQVVWAGDLNSFRVYRSVDGGAAWHVLSELPAAGGGMFGMAIAPSNEFVIYAGTPNNKILKSTNGGQSWSAITPIGLDSSPLHLAVSPTDPLTLLVGSNGSGVFRNTAFLNSWTRPLTEDELPTVRSIRFSTAASNRAYTVGFVGNSSRVFRSEDSGATWSILDFPGISSVDTFVDHPTDPDIYVLSGFPGNIQRSLDAGLTWESIDTAAQAVNGFGTFTTHQIMMDLLDPARIRALTYSGGIGEYRLVRDTSVAITALDTDITLDGRAQYTVTASNGAQGTAGRMLLTLDATDNGEIESATSASGECTVVEGAAECRLDQLEASSQWSVSVIVAPTWFGPIDVQAAVTSLEHDPLIIDNDVTDQSTTVVSADIDGDGVGDADDNCIFGSNADQRDSNADGYGNVCDADLDGDLVINVVDLGLLRQVFFSADADADFNGDGVVNVVDLGILRSQFFGPPGPSGVVGPQ